MYYNTIKYPCPINNKLTTTHECINCDKHLICDIYATMLDEDNDIEESDN